MRTFHISRTGDLPGMMAQARATCNPLIAHALNQPLETALALAKGTAPIYVRSRWPLFRRYKHHWVPPPGTLKKSIKKDDFKCSRSGALFTGRLGSNVNYANYVEEGVWEHHMSHMLIPGKRFLDKAVDKTFRPTLALRIDEAVTETFSGGKI